MRVVTGLCLSVLLGVTATKAACVLDDYSVEAEFNRSVEVVLAKVISERAVPAAPDDPNSIDGTNYSLQVRETFRGQGGDTLTIYSENSSGRYPLKVGRTYLLFLYEQQGRLSADNCGNSGLASEKRREMNAVRRLGKLGDDGQKPNYRLNLTVGTVTRLARAARRAPAPSAG